MAAAEKVERGVVDSIAHGEADATASVATARFATTEETLFT